MEKDYKPALRLQHVKTPCILGAVPQYCEKKEMKGRLDKYFATCGRGIETVLVDELEGLGAADVKPGRGGVHFAGDLALLYRANLWLRTAIRVLKPILEAPVTSPEELYEVVQSVD